MRDFDPVRLGGLETDAWVTYYQRRWGAFLRAAVGMVRVGFAMPWPRTILAAYLVLRANQRWAPVPDNDPDGARADMERFYRLVKATHDEPFDAAEAARLEVEWWRVHRYLQREAADGSDVTPLVEALAVHAAYVYSVPVDAVLEGARHRAAAMVISDRWVAAGGDPASPDVPAERAELIRAYTALLAAVRQGL
jgi:hypothetical protein